MIGLRLLRLIKFVIKFVSFLKIKIKKFLLIKVENYWLIIFKNKVMCLINI